MYNILISANDGAWSGEPIVLERGRCVGEYTDGHLREKFGDFRPEQVSELCRLPCIFAYESHMEKDPLFGVITDVIARPDKVKISYELMDIEEFIGYGDLEELEFELDLSKWELNRTHWAVKDVRLAAVLHQKGVVLPGWADSSARAPDITTHGFSVALSFPGEVRDTVEEVARELERLLGPDTYFYDRNYAGQLARPRMDQVLQSIYGKQSDLVVAFICEDYQKKEWCGVEFRAISEILLAREDDRIMYVRMDDGDVDGVLKTDGYLSAKHMTERDIAMQIEERVRLLNERRMSESIDTAIADPLNVKL